jgi:hypothetical protein
MHRGFWVIKGCGGLPCSNGLKKCLSILYLEENFDFKPYYVRHFFPAPKFETPSMRHDIETHLDTYVSEKLKYLTILKGGNKMLW